MEICNFLFVISICLLEYADNHPIQLVCLDAEAGFSPIATQRHLILGQESGGYGALVYSSRANSAINQLSDIKGKRLGVTFVLAAGGFALGWKVDPVIRMRFLVRQQPHIKNLQLLSEIGIDIFSDTAQVFPIWAGAAISIHDIAEKKHDEELGRWRLTAIVLFLASNRNKPTRVTMVK